MLPDVANFVRQLCDVKGLLDDRGSSQSVVLGHLRTLHTRRHENDGNLRSGLVLTQQLECRQPIHLRHHDVRQYEIGLPFSGLPDTIVPAQAGEEGEPTKYLQRDFHNFQNVGIIINTKDLG